MFMLTIRGVVLFTWNFNITLFNANFKYHFPGSNFAHSFFVHFLANFQHSTVDVEEYEKSVVRNYGSLGVTVGGNDAQLLHIGMVQKNYATRCKTDYVFEIMIKNWKQLDYCSSWCTYKCHSTSLSSLIFLRQRVVRSVVVSDRYSYFLHFKHWAKYASIDLLHRR